MVANGPILILIAMIFLKIENLTVSLILSFPLGWIALVNPLAAMIIITPYRRRLINVFSFFRYTSINPNVVNISLTITV